MLLPSAEWELVIDRGSEMKERLWKWMNAEMEEFVRIETQRKKSKKEKILKKLKKNLEQYPH